MTIYVVTTGDYSDYHILGVFSSEENAKKAFPTDEYRLEPYEIDTPEVVLKRVYSEVLQLSDGSRWVSERSTSEHPHDGTTHFACKLDEVSPGFRGEYAFLSWDNRPGSSYQYKASHVYAKSVISQEHATKVAAEGRQEYLRNGSASTAYSVEVK